MTKEVETLEDRFRGAEVSGVLFIRDYLELQFEELRVQFFAAPVLAEGSNRFSFSDKRSYQEFVDLIGSKLVSVEFEGDEFVWSFENSKEIRVRKGGSLAGETFNTITPHGIGVY